MKNDEEKRKDKEKLTKRTYSVKLKTIAVCKYRQNDALAICIVEMVFFAGKATISRQSNDVQT